MAKKIDLTNKIVGKLTVISEVPMNQRPSQSHGNYWLCKCACGNEVMVPASYLTGNGNYLQTSCGCDRKISAFKKTTFIPIEDSFLENFSKDFEKFLFIHKSLIRISRNTAQYYKDNIEEYKNSINKFWNDEQFNAIYSFWQQHKKLDKTFYDLAKPSLDHIIPISRGGTNLHDNLQFLTVFENLAKRDMTMEEWNNFKKRTNSSSDYYIENILKGGKDSYV